MAPYASVAQHSLCILGVPSILKKGLGSQCPGMAGNERRKSADILRSLNLIDTWRNQNLEVLIESRVESGR